ncbi:MAG: hypothetical protein GEU74_13020 [Nitriliruptorales bacterium]|nr:hypothetical protein [Nitriliruptorales bacterium]
MAAATNDAGGRPGQRFPRLVVIVVGAIFIAFGVWALAAPRTFYDTVAVFEPYNQHFIHDIGAFQMGLGGVLLLAAFFGDALFVALAGVAVGATAHLLAHIVDRDLGGTPASDIPFLTIIALALIAGALTRAPFRRSARADAPGA